MHLQDSGLSLLIVVAVPGQTGCGGDPRVPSENCHPSGGHPIGLGDSHAGVPDTGQIVSRGGKL